MSVSRVGQRVRAGGHHVPEDAVRRRYHRGLHNLFRLYMPLATHWRLLDGSAESGYPIIAFGDESRGIMVRTPEIWDALKGTYDREHLPPQDG
jgi:predicted ABC-type ATPase